MLVGARITVLTPQRAVVATGTTDQTGKFTIAGLADGQYVLVVKYPGLAERQAVVTISGANPAALDLQLDTAKLGEDVTVTAKPGSAGDLKTESQPVNVISSGRRHQPIQDRVRAGLRK